MTKYKHLASVSCIIYNKKSEILLVSPNDKEWLSVGGWLEDETIINCIQRELREELGNFNYQIIDIIDAHTFNYNEAINLISIWSLIKYTDGLLMPNDDIRGYHYKWFKKEELNNLNIIMPQQKEIIQKASFYIELYNKNNHISFYKYLWKEIL